MQMRKLKLTLLKGLWSGSPLPLDFSQRSTYLKIGDCEQVSRVKAGFTWA